MTTTTTCSSPSAGAAPLLSESCSTVALRIDAEADRVDDWRRRGADDATIAFCAAIGNLDQIIDANVGRKHHILVSSFPKSASTYLNKLLLRVTGFRQYWLNSAGHDNERNLELTAVPMFLAQHTVTQDHMRATLANVVLLQRMQIRPIVLVRNIFDVIVSSRDHSRTPGNPGNSGGGEIRGPNAHTPADFTTWSDEDQAWFIIRMGLPWYFTFLASWQDAQRALPVLWINYEDVVQRTAATVERILQHAGVNLPDVDIERLVTGVPLDNVRFNRGVSGRGVLELSAPQQQAVRDLASAYRGACDFSMIGL
jgi:hypothetical protein